MPNNDFSAAKPTIIEFTAQLVNGAIAISGDENFWSNLISTVNSEAIESLKNLLIEKLVNDNVPSIKIEVEAEHIKFLDKPSQFIVRLEWEGKDQDHNNVEYNHLMYINTTSITTEMRSKISFFRASETNATLDNPNENKPK